MKPIEQYEHVQEQFSDAWRADITDRVQEHVDNYLIMFGEPKEYRGFRHMGQVLADTFALWTVTEGYLVLPAKHVVSEEEAAERAEKRKAREQEPTMSRGTTREMRMAQGGSYL